MLAAEQTEEGGNWFQGTADAVRQSLRHMRRTPGRDLLILSGDQLYNMDYREMIKTHRESGADATVAVIPVAPEQASGVRHPQDGRHRAHRALRREAARRSPAGAALRSPRRPAGTPRLDGHLPLQARRAGAGAGRARGWSTSAATSSPTRFPRQRVQAHVYRGYWEDVGTIQSYFQANLALCERDPAV